MLYIFFYIFIVRDSTWITHLKKVRAVYFCMAYFLSWFKIYEFKIFILNKSKLPNTDNSDPSVIRHCLVGDSPRRFHDLVIALSHHPFCVQNKC